MPLNGFKTAVLTGKSTTHQADYSPFGMLLPNRHESINAYRYGFQGQEKDDEIAGEGNSYTAEYWQYDSRLGRRWNIDPVVKVHESPYVAFANNPIWFRDPNGADTVFADNQVKKDFNNTLDKVNNKIEEIKSSLNGLENQLASGKNSKGKDLRNSQRKKLEKTIKNQQTNLANWGKIADDFQNIINSTVKFNYTSDISILGKNEDGVTGYGDSYVYTNADGTASDGSVNIAVKPGRGDVIVHENRHAGQILEGRSQKPVLEKETDAFIYEQVYDYKAVQKVLNQVQTLKYSHLNKDLRPKVTIQEMVKYLYNVK